MDIETLTNYERYRTNWKKYVSQIKSEVIKLCSDTEVYIFGSVVKGNTHPTSDIDVLLVSVEFKNIKKRIETHSKLKLLFLDAPFEFHLIYPEKFPFYKKMAKEMVKI
ncbi:MAG: nucleotidyltransferase domain-containing protein [Thermodesulfobacteriota bacterium]